MKAILIVLDSVGIGEMPDAAKYGDEGSATLPHLAEAAGGINLPTLQSMGLGNIQALIPKGLPIEGVMPAHNPCASYGAMREVSDGKDTITGHWEIAGIETNPGFYVFPPGPPSFPPGLLAEFSKRTGRACIGDKASSGTAILDELAPEQFETGAWIVYTSADSVFQLAAHEDLIPIEELYRGCVIAREMMNPLKVGRVIARPYVGKPGAFKRTENRRDYAFEPPEPTILERLKNAGVPVYAAGKIEDIYVHRGISEANHTGNTQTTAELVSRWTAEKKDGLIFANFIDFDMLYGHRRDAVGYARSLEWTDRWLAGYLPQLTRDDILILTADHGNDPTFKGSDHTREFVPLLVQQPGGRNRNLGIRDGFFDIAQSLASFFKISPMPRGAGFL